MRRLLFLTSLLMMGCSHPPFSKFPKQPVALKVQPMVELDGLSAEEVFKLRDQAISAEPALRSLFPSDYKAASSGMLSGIESGRSWEGLEGWAKATDDNFASQFHAGPSLASAFLANPFLLVGLRSDRFCIGIPGNQEEAWSSEWLPKEINVAGPERKILCRYQWHPHCPSSLLMQGLPNQPLLFLETSNASDFGFVTFRVAKDKCQGVEIKEENPAAAGVMLCRQFYRATKLQRSRSAADVNGLTIGKGAFVRVTPKSFPMKIVLYLYRGTPTSEKVEPDVIEEIVVEKG